MPSLSGFPHPDADLAHWWQSSAGAPLLQAEAAVVSAALHGRPGVPWLWIGPVPAIPAQDAGRGLCLYRSADRLRGPLTCQLPLPLPTETFGSVVVQHVLDQPGLDGLLRECARVLEPGGKLWLFTLNPWSPYHLRWRKTGLRARDPREWQARLRRAGLELAGGEARYIGPVWRTEPTGRRLPVALAGLRAICLMEATLRVPGLIPPSTLRLRWNAGHATA